MDRGSVIRDRRDDVVRVGNEPRVPCTTYAFTSNAHYQHLGLRHCRKMREGLCLASRIVMVAAAAAAAKGNWLAEWMTVKQMCYVVADWRREPADDGRKDKTGQVDECVAGLVVWVRGSGVGVSSRGCDVVWVTETGMTGLGDENEGVRGCQDRKGQVGDVTRETLGEERGRERVLHHTAPSLTLSPSPYQLRRTPLPSRRYRYSAEGFCLALGLHCRHVNKCRRRPEGLRLAAAWQNTCYVAALDTEGLRFAVANTLLHHHYRCRPVKDSSQTSCHSTPATTTTARPPLYRVVTVLGVLGAVVMIE
ncbi:hypothetical protein E2C01_038136 [Portunus trituberculatus]|uniref:Uncharacterized protein n=1 Tax=Portunus trituberculatus TaxID=210409 RepID=A0A5B7FH82_PORTR|nr:hypothetical protein [Portunus trituberculatus]